MPVQFLNNLIGLTLALAQALPKTQVDQDIDECILIGDSLAVAEMWSFDAEGHGLAIDALDGAALAIQAFEVFTVAVKGVAQSRANARRHHRGAAAVLPILVTDRTLFTGRLWEEQRADVLATLMFHQTRGAVDKGELEGHRQTGRTDG